MKFPGSSPRILQFIYLTLVIIIGLSLSVYLFFTVKRWNQERGTAAFMERAEDCTAAVTSTIERSIMELDALQAFYRSSYEVERSEFKSFVEHLLFQDPAIQALEWIPRVKQNQREQFEARARSDGFLDFRITEMEGGGVMRPAGFRGEYFPIWYVEPYAGNEKALGYDLASDPVRRQALEKARRSGSKAATPRISLVQEEASQYGFLVFQPLYENGPAGLFLEQVGENLKGFLLLVFRVGDLLRGSLTTVQCGGVDMYLFDSSAAEGERFLARYDSASGLVTSIFGGEERAHTAGTYFADEIPVADRLWKLISTPRPGYWATFRNWQHWSVLLVGTLATGLLASYIFLLLIGREAARTHAEQMQAAKVDLEREVSQRARAERLARAERDRAQNYFDVAGVMLLVIRWDRKVALINRKGCEILGYSEEEIIGKDWFKTFLPGNSEDEAGRAFEYLMAGKAESEDFLENTVLRKDGQERLIAWHSTVIRDEEGAIVGTLSSGEDVTGRRRVEQALRESEEKYRMLFTAERDAIVVIDYQTRRIIDANDAALELYGYEKETMLSMSALDLSADPERSARNIAEMSALDEKGVTRHESYHRKRDGTLFPVEVSAGVFSLRGRRMIYAVFRDITERRKAEEAERMALANLEQQYEDLKKIDTMKDGLIRDVSHELKTPVAKHAMQLEILKPIVEKHRLSEEEAKALHIMEESIRRQEGVIRNLLDVSRLESGGRTYRKEPLRIDELIKSVIIDYEFMTERYGIEVDVDLPSTTIRSDEEMLWHLFSNLVSNAIKFRRKDAPARIAVSGESRDGQFTARVRDEGVGLSEEEIEKAFERFYQSTAALEGSGVGLTICRMIARGLGGSIGIDSEGKNRGTTVTVRIPVG